MNAKEILAKVKAVFDGTTVIPAPAPVPEPQPAKLATNFPVDGSSPVYVDGTTIEAGTAVWSDEGMTMPYPDGTFKITGKEFAFTVGGGVVTAVEGTLDAAAPAPPVAPMLPTLPQFEAMEKEVAELKKQNAQLQELLNKVNLLAEKHEKTIPGLFELADKLVELPVSNPKTLNEKQQQKFDYAAERDDRINQIAKTLKTIKTK